MGIINMKKEVKEIFMTSPNLDNVNFIEYFGLKKGKVFKYDIYEKEYSDKNAEGFIEKNNRISIKVINEFPINNGALFVLDNNLFDPSLEKEKQGILIVSNLVYHIANDKIENFIRVAQNEQVSNFFGEESTEEIFNLPFFNRKKYSDDITQFFRKDNHYQHYVQREGSYNHFDGEKMIELPKYRIYYISGPDTEYIEFIPYVGVSQINYLHKGTINEKTIYLTEVEHP